MNFRRHRNELWIQATELVETTERGSVTRSNFISKKAV